MRRILNGIIKDRSSLKFPWNVARVLRHVSFRYSDDKSGDSFNDLIFCEIYHLKLGIFALIIYSVLFSLKLSYFYKHIFIANMFEDIAKTLLCLSREKFLL